MLTGTWLCPFFVGPFPCDLVCFPFSWVSFTLFFRFYLLFERGERREKERREEKHPSVASCMPITRDLAHSPGTCPDWESIRWPFGLQDNAQPTEPHQPEQFHSLFILSPTEFLKHRIVSPSSQIPWVSKDSVIHILSSQISHLTQQQKLPASRVHLEQWSVCPRLCCSYTATFLAEKILFVLCINNNFQYCSRKSCFSHFLFLSIQLKIK